MDSSRSAGIIGELVYTGSSCVKCKTLQLVNTAQGTDVFFVFFVCYHTLGQLTSSFGGGDCTIGELVHIGLSWVKGKQHSKCRGTIYFKGNHFASKQSVWGGQFTSK